jgi:biopolymer transport protein TolR
MISSKSGKRDLNFELNLLPVFDILSCCICFLLMTVAWIQIGSLNVNQALGAQGQPGSEKAPAIWAYLNPNGDVVLNVKNAHVATWMGESILHGNKTDGSVAWNVVNQRIQAIRNAVPELKTALVMPTTKSPYQDIVHIMDSFKQTGISDVGISPL